MDSESASRTAASDAALVMEAMYQVAADPARWAQVIEALGDRTPDEGPSDATRRSLAHTEEIARIVGQSAASEGATADTRIGWIALSARGKVLAANRAAHAVMTQGLGELRIGFEPRFDNPDNEDALIAAIRRQHLRGERQTILRLDRANDEGPCFAYVVPGRSLPSAASGGAKTTPPDHGVIFPPPGEAGQLWATVRDGFGLTPAEIRLAQHLRDGQTLADTALALGVSVNTVRNQLRAVFAKMGLKRQSDLIRALSDLAQMAASVESPDPMDPAGAIVPIQSVILPDGRRLAYRDYGDPQGRAILLFHEGLGSSLLPEGAQSLATALSLRVISAERPGFGQSDPREDYSFDGVADDMIDLCGRLGLRDIRIAAILSGTPSAIHTAMRLGETCHGVWLCSGRPPRTTAAAGNLLRQFRSRLERNTWVVDTFYAILRLRLSPAMLEKMIRSGANLSPPDRAFLDRTPEAISYVSAYVTECLARTSRGPTDEIKAFRRAGNQTVTDVSCPITVWHGEHDQLAPLSELLDYLGSKPVDVTVFSGAGHLLAFEKWSDLLHAIAGHSRENAGA